MAQSCLLQGRWLATVLRGHYAYFAVPTNLPAVRALRHHIKMHWFLSLRRRSQSHRLTWSRMNVIAAKHLPLPRVLHQWPEQRFLVSPRGRSRMRELRMYGSRRVAPCKRVEVCRLR